ncbi:MAG: hypothetical protein EBW68_01790 [Actinobacteria bacterium]|nr:hypothetical protein [Actinomycetota bacterium]
MYFKITQEQLERAKHRNTFEVLKNSIKNGEGTYLGSVGEVVLIDYYINKGVKFEDGQNYDYDFKINDYKIDVKTQSMKYKPKPYFTCHIPNFNIKQDCDFYAFMFINLETNEAYCEGMIRKKDWKLIAKLKKQGEMGHIKPFATDTWICLISDLSKIN